MKVTTYVGVLAVADRVDNTSNPRFADWLTEVAHVSHPGNRPLDAVLGASGWPCMNKGTSWHWHPRFLALVPEDLVKYAMPWLQHHQDAVEQVRVAAYILCDPGDASSASIPH